MGKKSVTTPPNATEKLYVLYLNNTSADPELQHLLDAAKSDKKIVFQFIHNQDSILTLNAWPRSKKAFDKSKAVILNSTGTSCIDIAKQNVHLGNVHIDKDGYEALKKCVNQVGFQYIKFYPEILPAIVDDISYIGYQINGESIFTTACGSLASTRITGTANPSPPRPAN